MSVRRPNYRDKRTGKLCQQSIYWTEFVDHRGRRRSLAGFTERRATEDLERLVVQLVTLRATGQHADRRTAEQLGLLPPKIRERLATFDLIDATRAAASRPIEDVIRDFDTHLEHDKGTTDKHRNRVVGILRAVVVSMKARSLSDLDVDKIERDLRERREKGKKGTAYATSNARLRAIRSFCRWAVKRQFLDRDPTAPLSKFNEEQDRRYERRRFEAEELSRVLRTAENSGPFVGMPGPRRALIYRTAVYTGIRLGELAQLRVADFNLDGPRPTVRVPATASKNGEEKLLAIVDRPTIRRLKVAISGKLPTALALDIPGGWRGAEALRHDLALAGIAPIDELGRRLDFHSLRVTFVSWLAPFASPKTLQSLARHSTPVLTYNVYAKLGPDDEREALKHLPDLDAPNTATAAATGTDGTFGQTFGNAAHSERAGRNEYAQAVAASRYDSDYNSDRGQYDSSRGGGGTADAAALKAAGRQRP